MRLIDLTNKKFGNLTVLERDIKDTHKRPYWICMCKCGNIKSISGNSLRRGLTKSCGCICKEYPASKKHGMRRTRLYSIWCGMKSRCNKNNKTPTIYAKKGISVCDEWMNSFEAFRNWALQNGYDEKLTLDRIDGNGNYEPTNCRWVDYHEQHINRYVTRFSYYQDAYIPTCELMVLLSKDREYCKRHYGYFKKVGDKYVS